MKKFKKLLAGIMTLCMLVTMLPVTAMAEGANVAKVGNTEYATIDEAIENWTNNSTLTLLADVTLSDVITLKSTEHHILNLGTYTMTAADGKNAIEIVSCCTGFKGNSEYSALTINADEDNPGGINAGNKSVIYYRYSSDGIVGSGDQLNDRPVIYINGGVFTGATSGTAGIYTYGSAARKCVTLNISGGTFNCSINGSNKSKLLISGGTFNYSVGSQGDSTCYRLISGGKFKTIGFMTADSNNTKFCIGTSKGNSNVGVYVDDNGYIVVGGPVITEPGDNFEAYSANYNSASSYLQYSSAKNNGLYYTSVEEALADNNKASDVVTVYVDELDLTGSGYKGTIRVPDGNKLNITYAEETDPAWKVDTGAAGKAIFYTENEENGVVTREYYTAFAKTITFDSMGGSKVASQVIEDKDGDEFVTEPDPAPTKTGYTFGGWYTKDGEGNFVGPYDFETAVTEDITLYAKWTAHTYTVKFDANGGSGNMADQTFTYDEKQALANNAFTYANKYFNVWNTKVDGTGISYANQQEVENLTAVNMGSITLYAQWSDKPAQTITFDTADRYAKSNDGVLEARTATAEGAITYSSSDATVATVDENGVVTVLKAGEVWITATAAETNDKASISASYKLIIEQVSSGSKPKYSASIDKDEIENGKVTLSSTRAKAGSIVTITVTPDKGYELDELVVLDKDGDEVELTDKGNGKFTFKMPKGGVEIEASFEEIEEDEVEEPVVDEPVAKEETLVLTIGQVIYQLNDNYEVNDVAPIIRESRTFLPIRVVAETLGATVTWNEAEQTVTIVKDDTTIVIYIGQAFALVNGNPVQLDAPAFIANSRTYLPVRFVAENLGATVTWDAETQTVTIVGEV